MVIAPEITWGGRGGGGAQNFSGFGGFWVAGGGGWGGGGGDRNISGFRDFWS